jgi:site-specific DNA recombinase
MNAYFAYVRVSTVKQGEQGVSLHEQRDAIQRFADRNNLTIAQWFEERETAAKVGRREFSRMVAGLKKGKACGVIFHKIDRSARNLKDWSAVQDLADQGVDVRFTQESINLGSNEGKLTGDFLAVISAHYVRNLREEVKKGIRGRLKQGLYPHGAPIGYLDQGGGKVKVHDPVRAPLVRSAFELYGEGRYPLRALADELYKRGLRNKRGHRVHLSGLQKMLRNPFYTGLIRMRDETYAGIHETLISKDLFDRVQRRLDGKANSPIIVHHFLFRRMIVCESCKYRLIGELQRGHRYYRCHTPTCETTSVREEAVHDAISHRLQPFHFSEEENVELQHMVTDFERECAENREANAQAIQLQIDAIKGRLDRLMDAYLDGGFDRSLFEEKKFALLSERLRLQEELERILVNPQLISRRVAEILEQAKSVPLSYERGNFDEKRDIVQIVTSNMSVHRKNVAITLRSPFQEVANLATVSSSGLERNRPRTFVKDLFDLLVSHCMTQGEAPIEDEYLPDAKPRRYSKALGNVDNANRKREIERDRRDLSL